MQHLTVLHWGMLMEETMTTSIKLVSCPNCGGDDEPWFFTALGCEDTYEQTCVKCNYRYVYTDADVTTWKEQVCAWEPWIIVD